MYFIVLKNNIYLLYMYILYCIYIFILYKVFHIIVYIENIYVLLLFIKKERMKKKKY